MDAWERLDRFAEARHGATLLHWHLSDALRRGHVRLDVPGMPVWLDAETARLALAGEYPIVDTGNVLEPVPRSVSPGEAWDAVDSWVSPLSRERCSTHYGRVKAAGRDGSRRELLDEAIRWPVVRIALGLAVQA